MFGDPIKQESMSVLPIQEMSDGRHVQGFRSVWESAEKVS